MTFPISADVQKAYVKSSPSVRPPPFMDRSFRGPNVSATAVDAVPGSSVSFPQYVTGFADGLVLVWSCKPQTRPMKMTRHTAGITSVSVRPCGTKAASGSMDKTVRVFDLTPRGTDGGGVLVRTGSGPTRHVSWSADGAFLLAAGDDKAVKVWSSRDRFRFSHSYIGHTNWVRCAEYSRGCDRLVSCGDDKSVRLWDAETRKGIAVFSESTSCLMGCTFAGATNSIFAAGGADGSINVWDSRNWKSIGSVDGGSSASTGSSSAVIQHYEAHSGAVVTSIASSADGLYLASSATDGQVKIWDLREGRLLWALSGQSGSANCVRFDKNRDENCVGFENCAVDGNQADEGLCSQSRAGRACSIVSCSSSGTTTVWNAPGIAQSSSRASKSPASCSVPCETSETKVDESKKAAEHTGAPTVDDSPAKEQANGFSASSKTFSASRTGRPARPVSRERKAKSPAVQSSFSHVAHTTPRKEVSKDRDIYLDEISVSPGNSLERILRSLESLESRISSIEKNLPVSVSPKSASGSIGRIGQTNGVSSERDALSPSSGMIVQLNHQGG